MNKHKISIINLLPNLNNFNSKSKTEEDQQQKQIRPSIFLNFLELPLIFNRKKYKQNSIDKRQTKISQQKIKLIDSGIKLPYIKSQVPSRLSPCDNFFSINTPSFQSKKLLNMKDNSNYQRNDFIKKERQNKSPTKNTKKVIFRDSIQVQDFSGSIKRDKISDSHNSLKRITHRKVKSEFDNY